MPKTRGRTVHRFGKVHYPESLRDMQNYEAFSPSAGLRCATACPQGRSGDRLTLVGQARAVLPVRMGKNYAMIQVTLHPVPFVLK